MFIPERIEERIIKNTAEKLGLPINLVDRLNSFQWKIVLQATGIYSNIEITGLGRMNTKPRVINNNIEINFSKIRNCEQKIQATDDPKTIIRIGKRIEEYKENIEFLKSKLK